jgi:diguanylate cyclase (GGDEF)-like protein/PAS domain S-box-containing protein
MSCGSTLPNPPVSAVENVPRFFDVFSRICETVQMILDAEGRILSFNAFAADITGYSEAEAIAHAPWELLFDREHVTQVIEHFKDLPLRQKPLRVTLPIRCRNGGRRHGKWSVHHNGDEKSDPRYIVVSGIDITAEIELQDSDRRMRKMVRQQMLDLEKQNRHLQKISHFDHLTGIYNRRFFDDTLHESIDRQQHRDVPISLLMCDVDFFKQYNDTYGHVAGDAVLKKIGQLLSEFTRSDTDIAARYGGEEFALILPLTGRREARELAKRIQQAIAEAGILHGSSAVSPYITLSIGIATSKPSSLSDARSFVNLADRQLYLAKRNGRNSIVSVSHFGPPSSMK